MRGASEKLGFDGFVLWRKSHVAAPVSVVTNRNVAREASL